MANITVERRRLLKQMLSIGACIPSLNPLSSWANPTNEALLAMVHPELRTIAAALLSGGSTLAPLSMESLKQGREGLKANRRQPSAEVPIVRRVIAGAKGQPEVEIFIVNPNEDDKRPVVLHMHGGGFVMGSAQDSLLDLQKMSQALDCVIVSVEYRLAPETTYTGSIEDNYAALLWVYHNARAIGADVEHIAVMGESAGGAHAALLALVARDRGEVPVAFQCLVYPMLDDRTGSSRSVPPHIGKILWTEENNQFGWGAFLGVPAGSKSVPARAVPARWEDLSGLPPVFIGVGSLDLFADECMVYARRLNAAGVATELRVVPGAFHGFDALGHFGANTGVSESFSRAKLNALRQGLNINSPDQRLSC